MTKPTKTAVLVEGALMIALAAVLSYLKVYEMPQGGSITLEMIPLIVMSCRHNAKWGFATAFVHGLLQMIIGIQNVMLCPTLISQLGCILLDYLLGYGVLGFAGVISRKFGEGVVYITIGVVAACFLRYLCSFISGVWLWSAYAGEMNPVVYSAVYNASYMLPDTIIAAIVCIFLYKAAPDFFKLQD